MLTANKLVMLAGRAFFYYLSPFIRANTVQGINPVFTPGFLFSKKVLKFENKFGKSKNMV